MIPRPEGYVELDRLARNARPGDLIQVTDHTGVKIVYCLLEVQSVDEDRPSWYTNKRRWLIRTKHYRCGQTPKFVCLWNNPILGGLAYGSNTRITLYRPKGTE